MTKVFVHGVPDTPAVWRALLDRLRLADGDAVTLALPGLGNTPPDAVPSGSWGGWRPSLGGYVTGTGATRGVPAAGGR